MNKTEIKRIQKYLKQLQTIEYGIDQLLEIKESKLDSMSDNWKESDKGEDFYDLVQNIEEALSCTRELQECLQMIIEE